GWFPSTFKKPKTAFTFVLLDFFHELSFQSKVNAFGFYQTLLQVTDDSGLLSSPVNFQHSVRLWYHLHMLKHARHGHDPRGPDGTSEGELMVKCPACPHPNRNLPENWDKASSSYAHASSV
ncbi:hypothetical protein GLOTRDRAFT_48728, partial [Gloeophyllum trabeum ATCC 11539]